MPTISSATETRGDGMIDKRKQSRISCATKCILYHAGSKFRGVLENLSISGALVRLNRNLSDIIRPGDDCSLLICHLSSLSYSRHASQVKHLEATAVGVQFIFIEEAKRQQVEALPWDAGDSPSEAPLR